MMMYVARTFDASISFRALVLRSILSKYVLVEELGRSFSIIAIIEAFGKFVFVSIDYNHFVVIVNVGII